METFTLGEKIRENLKKKKDQGKRDVVPRLRLSPIIVAVEISSSKSKEVE